MEEKFEAKVPVCVEIDPTVMEVGVTPGALDVCAPALPADIVTRAVSNAAPANAVALSALNPSRTRMPSPFIRYVSPPGCRKL
jgi:hypothetical protein